MAFTVVAALVGAMILSITFIPAAVAPVDWQERWREGEPLDGLGQAHGYAPLLDWAMLNKPPTLTLTGVSVVLSGLLVTRMGSEFIPSLSEGDIALHALRIPGTSLTQAIEMQLELETHHQAVPGGRTGVRQDGHRGNRDGPHAAQRRRQLPDAQTASEWPDPNRSIESLVAALRRRGKVPGNNYEFTQPIQMRFNELISGVRSDVAVKVFGDDMAVMESTAEQISKVLQGVPEPPM